MEFKVDFHVYLPIFNYFLGSFINFRENFVYFQHFYVPMSIAHKFIKLTPTPSATANGPSNIKVHTDPNGFTIHTSTNECCYLAHPVRGGEEGPSFEPLPDDDQNSSVKRSWSPRELISVPDDKFPAEFNENQIILNARALRKRALGMLILSFFFHAFATLIDCSFQFMIRFCAMNSLPIKLRMKKRKLTTQMAKRLMLMLLSHFDIVNQK